MFGFQLYSFNVRGIRQYAKRKMIFRHLHHKDSSGIFLLQETHSTTDVENLWKNEWGGKIFYNHGESDSKGVAILISPGLDVNIVPEFKDDDGRILGVKILNDHEEFLVCNVYAPTRNKPGDQLQFLYNLQTFIDQGEYMNSIFGGDWNTIFDPTLDKQGGDMCNCTNRYTTDLLAFIETYELTDVIRVIHPAKKIFTRVQRNPTVMSRIDHWLISSHLCNIVTEAHVHPGVKSDHSIIMLSFTKREIKRGSGFWKFNCKLLRDKTFVELINKELSELKADTKQFKDKGSR